MIGQEQLISTFYFLIAVLQLHQKAVFKWVSIIIHICIFSIHHTFCCQGLRVQFKNERLKSIKVPSKAYGGEPLLCIYYQAVNKTSIYGAILKKNCEQYTLI